MNRIFSIILGAAAFLSLAACTGGNQSKKSQQTAPEVMLPAATRVSAISAQYQDVPQENVYSSTVLPYATNNIAPQTSARIKKINVEVGDFVRSGQIVAEMDNLNLAQARLRLVNDSTELSRLRGLLTEGGISQSDFDAAELAYKVSESSFENLLENTILRSPLNGVITARNYDRGDMYSMGQPIYVIQQISPVKILVAVSESDYSKVSRGDEVLITTDALPGKEFTGKVNRIYPTVDPASHTFQAEVVVTNSNAALRPGMFVRATLTFGVNKSIVIPDEAVVKMQGAGQKQVYVAMEDGTAKSKVITLGRHFDDKYEVLSGLDEGDMVIYKGHSSLQNGTKVEIGE